MTAPPTRLTHAMTRLKRRLRRPAAPPPPPPVVESASAADQEILDEVYHYTMTTFERQLGLLDAVDHVVANQIPGALVECGVWRGGSVLAMLLRLRQLGADPRAVFLYDTFDHMTKPGAEDVSDFSEPALAAWERAGGPQAWKQVGPEVFGQGQVRALLEATGYPPDRLQFVKGPVEDTIPATVPEQIAILRLDTDWYASTRHELEHLYPRLQQGGVLIVDDYGHWQGSRKAVDEYFAGHGPARPLLQRVDYACRMGVRVEPARVAAG